MQREHQLVQLMIPSLEINEAISQLNSIPTDVAQWATSHFA